MNVNVKAREASVGGGVEVRWCRNIAMFFCRIRSESGGVVSAVQQVQQVPI